ncbi:hypothetical protein EDP1_3003 [Pseudomonas putida S610]|nr:hypothetical protein EDP1_3003 [Pseudomonas putida S610]
MEGKNTAAARILEVLAFMAVINTNARDTLLLNEIIHTQLAEFFKSCTCAPPKEWQPVAPRVLASFLPQCIMVQ